MLARRLCWGYECFSIPFSLVDVTPVSLLRAHDESLLCHKLKWTEKGDAFRIGSDLNRLESETLPQYFRHSRFQSLVRQLNFYNFRKVNRERTFWIYKHNLFHRDRPEDLHLLRRRTCPGADGQRTASSLWALVEYLSERGRRFPRILEDLK